MAYLEDHTRGLPPRRRAKLIERSVDQALGEVASIQADERARHRKMVREAQAAVAGLPESHFAALAAKHGITARDAEAQLMRLAISQPVLVLKAVANTQAKLAQAKAL